jgi:hypothetical protein
MSDYQLWQTSQMIRVTPPPLNHWLSKDHHLPLKPFIIVSYLYGRVHQYFGSSSLGVSEVAMQVVREQEALRVVASRDAGGSKAYRCLEGR